MSIISITLDENTSARLRHAAIICLYHDGEALTIAAGDSDASNESPDNNKPDAHAELLERLASIQATALVLDQLGSAPGEQTGATLTAHTDVLKRLATDAIQDVCSEVAEPSYGAERAGSDWLRAQADVWGGARVDPRPGARRRGGGRMSPLTLAEKVWNIALADTPIGVDWGLETVHQGATDGSTTKFDTLAWDCIDWGYIYGVAFAIARLEDVFDTNDNVAARARQAARAVWQRYAGTSRAFGVDDAVAA